MPDNLRKITPADVLKGESPFVLTAHLEPVAGLDRFQPAGFPEIGHVIYKAPRANGSEEPVCIVDSPASMANHLESVCLRGAHDLDLVDDLAGMPYVRCVTGTIEDGEIKQRETVVTSLTEGHRIASTYFLEGEQLTNGKPVKDKEGAKKLREEAKKLRDEAKTLKGSDKKAKETEADNKENEAKQKEASFQDALIREFGIVLPGSKKAHPPAEKWWDVFKTLFQYDPNSLVHGVLFPQWNIKIPRFLTAHLEAFGAARVDRSGIKFDRLGKTTSGQPIFAVDDTVAQKIRATFILDASLVRSFGRVNGKDTLGLSGNQKEFLVALALWKIQRLLATPFRFRSGCHLALQKDGLKMGNEPIEILVDVKDAIENAGFTTNPRITDVYWPREELYREEKEEEENPTGNENAEGEEEQEENED